MTPNRKTDDGGNYMEVRTDSDGTWMRWVITTLTAFLILAVPVLVAQIGSKEAKETHDRDMVHIQKQVDYNKDLITSILSEMKSDIKELKSDTQSIKIELGVKDKKGGIK